MDTSRIKAKLGALKAENSKSGGKRVNKEHILELQPGKTTVRIVPLKSNPDWAFFESFWHFKVARGSVISPITFGQPDPIAEFAQDALETGGMSKEEWKQAKQLEPTKRIYAPVIVRGEENKGVQFWGFGSQIYEQILKEMEDEYGDISDLEEGTDIVIEKLTPEQAGNEFGSTSVRLKRNSSPVAPEADLDAVIELIKNQPDVTEIEYFQPPSYDELEQMLVKYLNIGSMSPTSNATPVASSTSKVAEPTAEATTESNGNAEKPNFKNLFG